MKKLLIALTLLSCIHLTATAKTANCDQAHQHIGNLNSITINNHTDKNIAYQMVQPSIFLDRVYQIPMKESDTYSSKFSDENVTFMVGVCSDLGTFSCNTYDALTFVRCTPHQSYNANRIKSIDINSLTSCTVTCLDGGSSSCVQTR